MIDRDGMCGHCHELQAELDKLRKATPCPDCEQLGCETCDGYGWFLGTDA
jgi:hypothetical protein